MKSLLYIAFLLLIPSLSIAQNGGYQTKFWQPTSMNGAITLGGGYAALEGTTNQIYDYQKTPIFYGGIKLNLDSYFWHPNFMLLSVGAEYSPEKNQDYFLLSPDRSEVRTLKRLDVLTTLFSSKPLTLSAFLNYNESFTTRENLSNIKINSLYFGGNLTWSNKFIPVQINYLQGKWDEKEIQTGRTYITNQSDFRVLLTKSISNLNRNELLYFHNVFERQEPNSRLTKNTSDNINLNNSLYFDNARNYYFNSMISATNQVGTETFKRLQAFENISLNLPVNFRFGGNYIFSSIQRPEQNSIVNNVGAILSHQLYESLNTAIVYQFSSVKYNVYDFNDKMNKYGFEVNYEKNTPIGMLNLFYNYYRQNQNFTGEAGLVQIINEEHTLTDGVIELLDKPYALPETVIVKDPTGTIIYQQYLDYILIERSVYLEIQRVPGGQIPNGATVKIDYTVLLPPSYQYDVNINIFGASLSMFKNKVRLYYRRSTQDYVNLHNTEYLTLNYIVQNVYGIALEYKFASGGVEYDDYNSSIIPYKLWRYYFQLQGNIKGRMIYSLNGDMHDYTMYGNNSDQKYANVTGNFAYMFSPRLKLNVELGYRKQIGEGINLDLIILGTDLTANYKKLYFNLGIDVYTRTYLGEELNYFAAYVRVVRNFDWIKR